MKQTFRANESGMAIVTALLVLMLVSGLMAGMFAALLANQRSHATDRDQSVAYAAAHAGLEKLTANLAGLFTTDFSPSADELGDIASTPPTIDGFEYTEPGGAEGSGYQITFEEDDDGNPLAFDDTNITTGPFEGFKGLVTPYTITVTARSTTGNSEVRLRRELQTVAVPVFQFGVFGEKSLGFHAGPDFDFGGRVHTNDTLFAAQNTGNTLTFRDKITAFNQVVRDRLMNGVSVTLTNHMGTVLVPMVIGGATRALRYDPNESSGTTASPWSGWKALSENTYQANIRTEATGAKRLDLPLVSFDAEPIDLIRRPAVNSDEDTENPFVFGQRYFAQASLRILLSDRAADITDLPTIDTTVAPVDLATLVVQAGDPPVPLAPRADLFNAANGTPLTRLDGNPSNTPPQNLTIETDTDINGAWTDGVPEWLKWTSLSAVNSGGTNLGTVTCTALTAVGVLSSCTHATAIPANSVVTFHLPDGTSFTATTTGSSSAPSGNITFVTGFTTALKFVATRGFFVGQDVVTCTGFTTNTLTGCSWSTAAGGDLGDDDPVYTGASTTPGTPLLHGFIKIERQDDDGDWHDVTMEILNLGFSGPNQQGALCTDPTPEAVIRMTRLRDNGLTTANACSGAAPTTNYSASLAPTDFWPNTLYDAREGWSRVSPSDLRAGGIISYVALDVGNFRRWVEGAIGTTGDEALENNGYIVYFSDRRGDHNEDDVDNPDIETGEYGFEDSINPAAATWTPTMTGRGTLETGENFNELETGGVATLETYGEDPSTVAGVVVNAIAGMGFDSASRPWTVIPELNSGRGRLARPVLFRRALKLVNGGLASGVNQLPATGFTVTSENPVYVQGHYNASNATATSAANSATAWTTLAEPNRPAAIIADAITLLSGSFSDATTFVSPNNASNRVAASTAYRFAMATGKAVPFTRPTTWPSNNADQEMGSDGGVHNFMRFLEDWNPSGGQQAVRYRGSMVSLFYSRQAIGIYRADGDIYDPPARRYNFDTDFLTPSLLPPGTPMFRDINTLKFRQILRPNQ